MDASGSSWAWSHLSVVWVALTVGMFIMPTTIEVAPRAAAFDLQSSTESQWLAGNEDISSILHT